jgi:hypothetical protein
VSIRSWWHPVRKWSMNIDVSKMIRLFTESLESQFTGMFCHQVPKII